MQSLMKIEIRSVCIIYFVLKYMIKRKEMIESAEETRVEY